MIIIGSRAMAYQFLIPQRITEKTDYDVIMSLIEFNDWAVMYKQYIKTLIPRSDHKYKAIVEKDGKRVQYEIELGFEGTSSKWLLDHKGDCCYGTRMGFFGELINTLDPDYLMLTKRSHLTYPIHFEKNMNDYQFMKQRIGSLHKTPLMEEYYNLRFNEAKERNKQRTPKLNVTTEDFFSSKLPVQTYFVHDHIHEVIAHYDKPVYTMMQKDISKAWCEKDMFFKLPYSTQVRAVMEEAYVIALERYIIPQHGENCNDYHDCYTRAVKRICTTLTSGWFRDFAIENYNKVLEFYNPDFVNKFIKAYKSGKIKYKEGIKSCPLMEVI
jgi:hypothetical protein